MKVNLIDFKVDVHRNAVEHGWWGEEYTDAAVIDLIHAEISEAFEEWRAGRPMLWHECGGNFNGRKIVCETRRCSQDYDGKPKESCVLRLDKPEGIAVELIDVVLRILDAAEAWGVPISNPKAAPESIIRMDVPTLTATLHYEISHVYNARHQTRNADAYWRMMNVISFIMGWIRAQGPDPEELLMEKHRYNVMRPFKHGGKKC